MGTVLLILLLLALCGGIAYIGDLLGRRFGKRRLTVFGLRPKHTAVLLTIVTGVVIGAVTFGTAMTAMPFFRRAVLEGEALQQENRQLAASNALMERLRSATQGQIADLKQASARLDQELASLTRERDTLKGERDKLQGERHSLLESTEALGRNVQLALDRNRELVMSQQKLEATNTSLLAEENRLRSGNQRLRGALRNLQTSLAKLERDLNPDLNSAGTGQFAFEQGERIEHRIVLANAPADVLEDALTGVLEEAALTASARHAGSAPAGSRNWLRLERPAGFPDSRPARPEEYRRWLSAQMRRVRDQQIVLEVVALENTEKGKVTPVQVTWCTNDVVFQRGEIVDIIMLSGRDSNGVEKSSEELLRELNGLLQRRVIPLALQRKMVRSGQVGGSDWAIRLGALRVDQAVIQKIQSISGNTLVTVRARQETRRAGPLLLDLEAQPVAGEPLSP